MDNFFKNVIQSIGKKTNARPVASARSSGSGEQGKRLGGTKPGTDLVVTFAEAGSLGVRVEKSEGTGTGGACIVSYVAPDSQASAAGLRRGDIICFAYVGATGGAAGSPEVVGENEITHEQFLKLVKGNCRPLTVVIRRIELDRQTSAAAATSANAEVRRNAMIAAVEARERAHLNRTKPIDKSKNITASRPNSAAVTTTTGQDTSEETKRAIALAKAGEAATAVQLGYNPYEVARATGEHAKMAVVAAQGTASQQAGTTSPADHSQQRGNTAATRNSTSTVGAPQRSSLHIDETFDHALMVFLTSNNETNQSDVSSSIGVIRKLILNATTKGMSINSEEGEKYRRVRLSNPKIKSAVLEAQGGLDIMLACGFELVEQDAEVADNHSAGERGVCGSTGTETFLVYPLDRAVPEWIPRALEQLHTVEISTT